MWHRGTQPPRCPDVTDLLNEAFYAELLRRVKSGEFSAVIAAPPCSTFSIARFFPVANNRDHGPPPVRTRDSPRGIVEQSAGYKLEAERANLLVTRTCTILGAAFNIGAEFILENPADRGNPQDRYLFLHADHAPIWVLSEVQLLQEDVKKSHCSLGTRACYGIQEALRKLRSSVEVVFGWESYLYIMGENFITNDFYRDFWAVLCAPLIF